MGLGPSIKMTTLHHYNCPLTRLLLNDPDINFCGVLVDGVSEGYPEKTQTAAQTAILAEKLQIDGAIVAIDGWGNHHVDFVTVIEQLGIRNIPSIGLSYLGNQGQLVCSNPYVKTIIDFNKSVSGYESCIIGQNNLCEEDAYKAIGLLKHRIKKETHFVSTAVPFSHETCLKKLTRNYISVSEVRFGSETIFFNHTLTLRNNIASALLEGEPRLKECHIQFISPENHDTFVNSNLDFQPIAYKVSGSLGEGVTCQLSNLIVMLTGVEYKSGYQPANIGSSEGILSKQVVFQQTGTPKTTDYILHIDFLFQEGEARTAAGIEAAHRTADHILQEIRSALVSWTVSMAPEESFPPFDMSEDFYHMSRPGKMKIALIKIVSGLGNMYDTSLLPYAPAGFIGSKQMRLSGNIPVFLMPTQVLDGVIHSLI